jgi:16S rRNA (guanine966-N2)-methyltransferase
MKSKKSKGIKPGPRNQIRIIGGSFRGRKITFPDSLGLRPTPDRVRETLFNWLSPVIREAKCLDLFAGSGALSFEAISRGAKQVVMLEKAYPVFQSLQAQANALQITNLDLQSIDIQHIDSQSYLANSTVDPFDIVFVDPPYGSGLLLPSIELLHKRGWLRQAALIYCGTDQPIKPEELPPSWEILRQQKAGVVYFYLIKKIDSQIDN